MNQITLTQDTLTEFLSNSVDTNGCNGSAKIVITEDAGTTWVEHLPGDSTSSIILSAFSSLHCVVNRRVTNTAPKIISLCFK